MPQFGTLFGVSEGKTLNVNSKIVLKRLVLLYQVAKAHIKQFLHVPLNVLHAASRADMEQRGRTEVANTPDLKMLLPFVPKHGFRFNLMRVVRTSYALRQLTKDLPCAQSALILSFVWPSHRQRKSYSKARGHACDSAQYFATLLLLLSQLGCSVHVVAHSLGCRVAMAALLELEEARETCVQLKYMALLGGAVAREALEPEGEFPLRRPGDRNASKVCVTAHLSQGLSQGLVFFLITSC
ncbi:unnamed protein product [Durusdinium trenchii]|uniref:ATP-binding cassette sub-family F member 3 n=2 Tax=Durusdinium trenchii TaxID=1381693 RepID=A0ABP0QB28_9DINO